MLGSSKLSWASKRWSSSSIAVGRVVVEKADFRSSRPCPLKTTTRNGKHQDCSRKSSFHDT